MQVRGADKCFGFAVKHNTTPVAVTTVAEAWLVVCRQRNILKACWRQDTKVTNHMSLSDFNRTTYLFSYLDADERRPSLEAMMDDYWRLMPSYQVRPAAISRFCGSWQFVNGKLHILIRGSSNQLVQLPASMCCERHSVVADAARLNDCLNASCW